MSRDRALLHVDQLRPFADYCVAQGWVEEVNVGDFEALRMRHPVTRERLYVHRKDRTLAGGVVRHLTVWGASERLAREFITAKYSQKHPRRSQDGAGSTIAPVRDGEDASNG